MPTTSNGIVVPAGSVAPNVPTVLQAMADSFNSKLVGQFASTSARDTALAAEMAAGTKMLALITSNGPCWFNGTTWEWIGSPPTPITYLTGFGVSSDLNSANPTWTTISGYSYTFTPTLTGFADVYADWDVQQTGAFTGWGSATFRALVNGIVLDQAPYILFDTGTTGQRVGGRTPMRVRVKLYAGVSVTFTMQVQNASASGLWKFNSFAWVISQQ